MLTQFKFSTAFEIMSKLHYPTKEEGQLSTSTILGDSRFNSSSQNQDYSESATSEVTTITTIVIAVSVCVVCIIVVIVSVFVIKRRRESRPLGQHESIPLSTKR